MKRMSEEENQKWRDIGWRDDVLYCRCCAKEQPEGERRLVKAWFYFRGDTFRASCDECGAETHMEDHRELLNEWPLQRPDTVYQAFDVVARIAKQRYR